MKDVRTIGVTVLVVILVLLVVGLGYQAQTAQVKDALSNLKTRIGELKVLKEEQTLTRDIMLIQQEIRELTLKAQAPPVIEGTFIPIEDLPENMKKQN